MEVLQIYGSIPSVFDANFTNLYTYKKTPTSALLLMVVVFSSGSGEHIGIFKIFKKSILGHVSS